LLFHIHPFEIYKYSLAFHCVSWHNEWLANNRSGIYTCMNYIFIQ
jgi:hypothetical protein